MGGRVQTSVPPRTSRPFAPGRTFTCRRANARPLSIAVRMSILTALHEVRHPIPILAFRLETHDENIEQYRGEYRQPGADEHQSNRCARSAGCGRFRIHRRYNGIRDQHPVRWDVGRPLHSLEQRSALSSNQLDCLLGFFWISSCCSIVTRGNWFPGSPFRKPWQCSRRCHRNRLPAESQQDPRGPSPAS